MIKIISPSRFIVNKALIQQTALDYLVSSKVDSSSSLNIIFIGRRKMKLIGKKYKKELKTFPILSFNYADSSKTDDEILIGEIFICYPMAVLLAAEKDKTVDEIINFLVNHGLDNILSGQ
jgi:ssRNA-specific RNase YbeY (16S rRNA maturation enzyme)